MPQTFRQEQKGLVGSGWAGRVWSRRDTGTGRTTRRTRAVRYLALGDSISIDDYTGVAGGGAARQFASLVNASAADFHDLTVDGNTTAGVLASLDGLSFRPEVVTLTAGGNDLLMGSSPRRISENLRAIIDRLLPFDCPVILNTIYDPTDGDDQLAGRLGVPVSLRQGFNAVNEGIRSLARTRQLLLADLERLFAGHGVASPDPWLVLGIEPNHAGATAIARHWYALLSKANEGEG